MTKTYGKSELVSHHVTQGHDRAPHRSYLYAMGLGEAQINTPLVGVAGRVDFNRLCWYTHRTALKTVSGINMSVTKSKSAFSLVELSIVLVILGLLVGGVLSGQSLIRAAELRSITADTARFVTASYSFHDKYFALAGDMSNAESFWGPDSSGCPSGGGATGTCNGNGDGILSGTNEGPRFWQQLALAGLIEGKYSGVFGAAGAVPGTNVPRGKISNTGYSVTYLNYTLGDWANLQMNYGNQFAFGSVSYGFDTSNVALKPEELWNIDTKIDDGKPGQGNIIAIYWDTCTTAGSFTDLNGAYALDLNSVQCAFRYKNVAG